MATSEVGFIRTTLLQLLKQYFAELKNRNDIDLDTTLADLELGDTWLIEYIFVVEGYYHIDISDDMAKKHFVRIRNAAKYLAKRIM